MRSVSLGIMAYNEGATIGRLLDAVLAQNLVSARLDQIIVVASGCTDATVDIVRRFAARDGRIQLLIQQQREGKAAAINCFLQHATGEIVILSSGDVVPDDGALEALISPFTVPSVGMTGGRPVPINSQRTFLGYAVHLLWDLHHRIALQHPKLGEVVAFRRLFESIPADTAVDEASIEALVRQNGLQLRYVPEAIVRNKGPETVRDFLKQRRRIAAGHCCLSRTRGYAVSTLSPIRILRALLSEQHWGPRECLWTAGTVLLEVAGRMLGHYDHYIRKKNPYIWDIAESTKTWT